MIELLVVIAIIGVLSSVVLASLNSARAKGANAVVKSDMSNLRDQGELYYTDNYQSYAGVCTSTQFISILGNATSSGGGPATAITTYCASDPNAWSAYSNLKVAENGSNYWCSSNSGASKATSSVASWATSSCQ